MSLEAKVYSLDDKRPTLPTTAHAVPPWSYNPSSWKQRVLVCVVAFPAVGISFYLGLFQLKIIESVWDPIFAEQSAKVLLSDVSHTMTSWLIIPDAMLGSLAYLGDMIFALAGSTRRWQYRPWLVVLFGLDVIPLGIVSAVLVVIQGTILGSWCFLCIVTAIISLALVVLAYDEVWSSLKYLWCVYRRSRSFSILARTFLGIPSTIAHEVGEEFLMGRRHVGKDK